MPGFNFFRVYPAQKGNLSQLLISRGIQLTHTKTVVDGTVTYQYDLFFTQVPQVRPIKWITELRKEFPIPTHDSETYSAALLISYSSVVYAITFGSAHFYVSRFSDFEFGIALASRILAKFSTKNSREFSGVRTKSIETYVAADELAYEAGEAVNYIKGTPVDARRWGKSVSCGQSVMLRKRTFSVTGIHKLCVQLENSLSLPVIKAIPTSLQVRDAARRLQLGVKLAADMQAGRYMVAISQQQLSGVAFLFTDQYEFEFVVSGASFQLEETTTLAEVSAIVTQHFGGDYQALLNTMVTATEDGVAAFSKPFIAFIDYVDTQDNYYLDDGKWYQFDKNYLSNVRNEINRIDLLHSTEIPRFDEATYQRWYAAQPPNLKYYRERYLNDQLGPALGYVNHDRNYTLFENAKVEIADLVKNDTIYVVKLGSTQTLSYAIDQATAAVKVLERNRFEVSVTGSPVRIQRICLWLFLERQSPIVQISEVNSLIFLTKLAFWRKTMLLAGLQPQICVSYK